MRTKDLSHAEALEPDLQDLLDVAPRVAPGKRTRAERLPPRPTAALPPHSEHHAAPAASAVRPDPFGLHLSALPALEASPRVVLLRGGVVGKARSAQVQITNHEPTAVELVDLFASHAGLQGWIIGPRTLEPGESTVLTITYEPTAPGSITGKLTLVTADGTGFDIPVEADAKVFGPQLPPAAAKPPAAPKAPAAAAPTPAPATDDAALATDDTALASFAVASPLVASPATIGFDDDTRGDVATLLTLVHIGSDPVSIDSVSIAGGEPGFGATLLGDADLLPGAATSVAIDYRAAAYTSQPASLQVVTSDGGVLVVPIRGPRLGTIDVLPPLVILESDVGRQTDFAAIVLRNRSRKPVEIRSFDFGSPAERRPFLLEHDGVTRIAAGAEAVVQLSFMSSTAGTHDDSIAVVGLGGKVFATIRVQGIARATTTPADPAAAPPPPDASCPTDDAETKAARASARNALNAWVAASTEMITTSHATLAREWTDYLRFTGLSPSISRAVLPDASIVRGLLSNAFGNALTTGPLDPRKTAPSVTRGVANGLAGAVTDDVAIAVGMVASGGVGLVVGVLIETLAGVLFDQLVGDDAATRNAAQELYDQGRADGGVEVGQRIIDRQAELSKAQAAALASLQLQTKARQAPVDAHCDAGVLRELADIFDAEAAHAQSTRAAKGVSSRELLALWARDHAASTTRATSDVVGAQWRNVTEELARTDAAHFEKGKLKNQPDLFISQCAREWETRGLRASPEIQAALRGELDADPTQLQQPENAAYFAQRLQRRLDGREFVWDRTSVDWGLLGEGLPRANEGTHDDWETVSCRPSLAVENGSCVVTTFRYRIQTGSGVLEASTRPGHPRWHVPENRPGTPASAPPPHALARELLGLLDGLEQAGFTIRQEADAASHAWLKSTFGERAARPETQHADGRDEPVAVFRVVEPAGNVAASPRSASCPEDRKPLPPALEGRLRRFTRIDEGRYSMFRGGNTILVLERCDAQ